MTHQHTEEAALLATLTSEQRRRVHRLMQTTGASLHLAVEAVQAIDVAPPHKPARTELDTAVGAASRATNHEEQR